MHLENALDFWQAERSPCVYKSNSPQGDFALMKTNISCRRFNAIVRKQEGDTIYIAQLRCKQWDCSYCAKKNARQWKAALIHAINQKGGKWSFWTITLPYWIRTLPESKRYEAGAKIIRENWDKFNKRWKRKYGKQSYIRVIEQHQDNTPHIHLLVSCHIPDVYTVTRKDGSKYGRSVWHEEALDACNFGYIYDIRNLTDEDTGTWHAGAVAMYVTKYMTKDLTENDKVRKKIRVNKIQTSRDIKRVNLPKDPNWRMKSGLYLEEFSENDLDYYDVSTKEKITLDHFRDGAMYPPFQPEEIDEN